MAVIIDGVKKKSPAGRAGIRAGDSLISVNGQAVNDFFDYGFYTLAENLSLKLSRDGTETDVLVRKSENGDLGLEFNSFLMDAERRCENRCVLCFIDQLPPNLRKSLYFKDDDARLSYLFGNYITLTNLEDADIERIVKMRITPINISVHTTDKELRNTIMGNKKAGESMRFIPRLAAAGIEMNFQIVLCRGINDGEALEKTMTDMEAFFPALRSVSVVPAGLTAHRGSLYRIESYGKESAAAELSRVEARNKAFRERHGIGLFYPADEWYLLAGREIPAIEYYDGCLQLENGVGMLAELKSTFFAAMDESGPGAAVSVDIITGEAAADWIKGLINAAKNRYNCVRAEIHTVRNDFFGGNVSVAGLLAAGDIMRQIKPEGIRGERLLIPRSALRGDGDLFLDGVSIDAFSNYYSKEVISATDGSELFRALWK